MKFMKSYREMAIICSTFFSPRSKFSAFLKIFVRAKNFASLYYFNETRSKFTSTGKMLHFFRSFHICKFYFHQNGQFFGNLFQSFRFFNNFVWKVKITAEVSEVKSLYLSNGDRFQNLSNGI